jgi:FkbM family methyltransferase
LAFLRVQATAKHRGAQAAGGRLVTVRLKNDPRPLFLRPGSSDGPVLKEIFLWDEYGPLLREVRGPVRTVIDLGSNIGLTVRLWQARFPGARVCAVEPDEANATLLERNVLAPPLPEAGAPTVVRACVAGAAGFVTLDRSGAEWGITMTREGSPDATQRVEAITVSELLRRFGHEAGDIDILKCDIEGAEAEVFAGECEWLVRVRHLAIEVHQPYDIARFLRDVDRIAPGRFRVTHQWPGNPNSLVFLRREQ